MTPVTYYRCDICAHDWPTPEEAVRCESRPTLPALPTGTLVRSKEYARAVAGEATTARIESTHVGAGAHRGSHARYYTLDASIFVGTSEAWDGPELREVSDVVDALYVEPV